MSLPSKTPFGGFRLTDGPAEGTYLVKRAPVYLRAVVSGAKKDVLDLMEDAPTAQEEVYVYKLRPGTAGHMHINFGSTRRGTGFYASGAYWWLPEVDGEALRDNAIWQSWVLEQWEKRREGGEEP